MKIILLLAFALACTALNAQNAFYDSKTLSTWGSLNDSDKVRRAPEFYTILLRYADHPDSIKSVFLKQLCADIQKTNNLVYLMKTTAEAKTGEVFRKIIGTDINQHPEYLKKAIAEYKLNDSFYEDATEQKRRFTEWFERLPKNTGKEASAIITGLQPFDTYLTARNSGYSGIYKTGLENADSAIVGYFTKPDESVLVHYHRQFEIVEAFYGDARAKDSAKVMAEFSKLSADAALRSMGAASDANRNLYSEAKKRLDQYNQVMQKTQLSIAPASGDDITPEIKFSISDQNFPTQSEVIDALAIYVAQRFRQEIALTFLENFTRYLKGNLLASELFPATYRMLDNSDPYSVPKIGSEWRNAVSEDLLRLPENLVGSTVVKKWVNNDEAMNYLADGVLFGKYVAKKFSFIDMIRSLYQQNGLEAQGQVLRGTYSKKALLVAFIINEEFYDSTKATKARYWIAPEELYNLKWNQAVLLKELISLKYDSSLKASFETNPLQVADTEFMKIKNRYTDLLTMFKQFESSQLAAYLANRQGGNIKDAFWDFQRIFLDFMIKECNDAKTKSLVRGIQKVFYLYDYISNKNYGAAINTSLELLDTMLQKQNISNYLRGFVAEANLAALERVLLTGDAGPDTIKLVRQLEAGARLLYLVGKNKPKDSSALQQMYQQLYSEKLNDLFDDSCLSKWNYADPNELIKRIYGLIAQTRTELKKKKGIIEEAMKNLSLYEVDSYEKLNTYIRLIENYLLQRSPGMITTFRKVSGFLTDAAKATDSKELSKVLEGYAQPPLSYKLTRRSVKSIDVNAYLGGWLGGEFAFTRTSNTAETDFTRPAMAGGLTVPLGLSFSWGGQSYKVKVIKRKTSRAKADKRLLYINNSNKPKFLTGTSHTLFFSVVDIAGPVAFRLGNDTAKGLPQTTRWAQLLAPGVHYVMGIRNAPLCISVGFQVSPQLRSYQNISSSAFSTGRVQLAILYDMPLINLSRKKAY